MDFKELANQLRSAAELIEDLKEVKEEKLPESWGELTEDQQEAGSSASVACNKSIQSAMGALSHLYDLRQEYRRIAGWEPDWQDEDQPKYSILIGRNGPKIIESRYITRFLTFPNEEHAEHFLKHHKGLIEEAQEFL